MEEFYAQDLQRYYGALVTHQHHNYSYGRNEADITPWLDYFLMGMAAVFERVAELIQNEMIEGDFDQESLALLRSLDYRARRVLGLFNTQELIQSSDVASMLGISVRQTRDLLTGWVANGWLEVADPSKRGRKYRLAEEFQILLA